MQNRDLLTTAAAVLVALSVLYGIGTGPVHAKPVMPAPLTAETKASAVPKTAFVDAAGGKHSIGDFKGRYVLVNLWATWCAPCVSELPSLVKLQAAMPGLKVLAVDVGHDKPDAAAAFLKSHKADSLGIYVDTELALLHAFGAYGLPTTVLIDPSGKEVAKAQGPAEWNAPQFVTYFKSLTSS
jgi:thiol-disulfide isomerase/thioredoxin